MSSETKSDCCVKYPGCDFDELFPQLITPTFDAVFDVKSYRGIERTSYPNWDGWKMLDGYFRAGTPVNLADLDFAVREHYRVRFYNSIGIDKISNERLALALFEGACKFGKLLAVETMQKALNLLVDVKDETNQFPVPVDGMADDYFFKRVNQYAKPRTLLISFMVLMGSRFAAQPGFFKVWLERNMPRFK